MAGAIAYHTSLGGPLKGPGMSRPKVLCMADLELLSDALVPVEKLADVDYMAPDREALLGRIGEYDAYYCACDVRLDREIVERASRLKVVITPSTGTDHIDREALQERGIAFLALTYEYDMLDTFTATAEHSWGLLLACMRRIPAALDAVRQGRWARWRGFLSHQLSCKTLGVLGVGRLGKMVVEYGKAFRMRVLGCDPKDFDIPRVHRVDYDTLLAESDVISLHVHLTNETRRLLSREAFAKMKDGVIIINTSRGGLIDEEAMLEGLESGKVDAAGLDLIDGEWMEDIRQHLLVRYAQTHDNLIITPHIASSTVESIAGGRIHAGHMLAEYLKKQM